MQIVKIKNMIKQRYIILYILILTLLLQLYIIIIYNIFKTDHYNCKYNKIYKKILLSDLYPYFKTGDLLFFSFNDVDIKSRGFFNNRFSHMAMIYENNGNLYTLEMNYIDLISSYNNKIYKNFNIMPLDERIQNYSGTVYYSSLLKELTLDQKNKLDYIINNAQNYKYSSASNLLLKFLLCSNKVDNKEIFCSEFIAELLHELDISSSPYKSIKFRLSDNIVNLTNNIIYTNPILILVDKLMIKDLKDSNYLTYC